MRWFSLPSHFDPTIFPQIIINTSLIMLTTTATAALFSLLPLLASASPVVSRNNNKKATGLNGLAARTNRYVGTATNSFNVQGISPVGPYNEVLDYEFAGALTPENEGKWEVIHPEQNVYNFTGMDIVSIIRKQRLSLNLNKYQNWLPLLTRSSKTPSVSGPWFEATTLFGINR